MQQFNIKSKVNNEFIKNLQKAIKYIVFSKTRQSIYMKLKALILKKKTIYYILV